MFISKSPVHTYRASLEDLEKKTFKKSRSHFLTRKFMIFPYFFRNYVIIFEPMWPQGCLMAQIEAQHMINHFPYKSHW